MFKCCCKGKESGARQKQIRRKLIALYSAERVEDLTRILLFLDGGDIVEGKKQNPLPSLAWKTLKELLHSDQAFKKYADRLIEEIKKEENDKIFRKNLTKLYDQMQLCQSSDVLAAMRMTKIGGFFGLQKAWHLISSTSQTKIVRLIEAVGKKNLPVAAYRTADTALSILGATVSAVTLIGLSSVNLTIDAFKSLWLWWKGEISGERCAMIVLDAAVTVAAGAGGAAVGVGVGAIFGPIGMAVGGIIGFVVTSATANALFDKLKESLFGIPKEEALENAYRFLEVNMKATNDEINKAFRRLALKYHPDKGGSEEDFILLNTSMALIKVSRGEQSPS